jgi:hypothetical protein
MDQEIIDQNVAMLIELRAAAIDKKDYAKAQTLDALIAQVSANAVPEPPVEPVELPSYMQAPVQLAEPPSFNEVVVHDKPEDKRGNWLA